MRSVSAALTRSTLSPPRSRCPSCGLSCARRAARHSSRCRTVELSRRSAKGVEQSLCRNEIGGSEPLGKAAVDGRQQLARLAHPLLFAPAPGEARRRPQLPGKARPGVAPHRVPVGSRPRRYRAGRKPLLLAGSAGMAVTLVTMVIVFATARLGAD